ncbi:MAG TPA: DUF1631 family protein [Burkholderiaceae bacterium]|nr:DUF1631 family protein [Burkholderiaceae bacterium]
MSDKLTVIRESLANACKIAAMEFVKLPEISPEAEDAVMQAMRSVAKQSTDAPKLYWSAEERLKTEYPARLQTRMAMACEMLLNRAQRKLVPLTAAQMELLADDELDRRLAVTDFSRRLSAVNDAAIDLINYRIKRFLRSASLGAVEIQAPENPFGPSLILDTLARFWDECASPLGGSPTLLRHYGEHLIPCLQSCYAKLNSYLESVHPLEAVAPPVSDQGSVRLGLLAPVELVLPPPPPPPPPADALASLTAGPDPELQRAIQAHAPMRPAPRFGLPPAGESRASSFPTLDLSGDGVQTPASAPTPLGGDARGPSVSSRGGPATLWALLCRSPDAARLSEDDSDVLQLLSNNLELLVKDKRLLPAVQAGIHALKQPLLQYALVRRSFFTSPADPVRSALTHLSTLSTNRAMDAAQFGQLTASLIDRATRAARGESPAARQTAPAAAAAPAHLPEWVPAPAPVPAASSPIEAVADAAARIAQEDREARKRVALAVARAHIEKVTADKPLPPFVRQMIDTQWVKVLAAADMKRPADDTRWNEAARTLDTLIWSLRAPGSTVFAKALKTEMHGLLKGLNAGFDRAGWQGDARSDFLVELARLHFLAMQGASDQTGHTDPTPAQTATPNPAATDDPAGAAAGSITSLLEPLAVNASLQVADGAGGWAPWRVTWISPMRKRFVIGNPQAGSSRTLTDVELRDELVAGRIRLG